MGRMSDLYFVVFVAATLCSGCPTQQVSSRPMTVVPVRNVAPVETMAPVAQDAPAEAMIDAEFPAAPLVNIEAAEEAPAEPVGLRLCPVPEALAVDPQLEDIVSVVAEYWTEQGELVVLSTPELGCEVLLDVGETALGKDGWGSKEGQTWIPKRMSVTNPAITRFKLEFWTDPTSSVELKAALAAHEIGHVLLGVEHEPDYTGKLMSPIVTEDLAQELFGGKL